MAKTNKQLDALQMAIDEPRQQKSAIEIDLNEAERAFYAAKREVEKNEKPTPAMLKALSMLVAGGILSKGRWERRYYLRDVDGLGHYLNDSVFYGLRSRQALAESERDGNGTQIFKITEHGRAILTKHSTSQRTNGITTVR